MQCLGISLFRFRERYADISQHSAVVWRAELEIVGFDGADTIDATETGLGAEQVGCALSHLVAYEALLARGLP
jgi:glycosyl transferase family 25